MKGDNFKYIDLAQELPEKTISLIGLLTINFGRLEHMTFLALKRLNEFTLDQANLKFSNLTWNEKINGGKSKKNKKIYGLRSFAESQSNNQLMNLVRQLDEIRLKRNNYIHGLYAKVGDRSYLHNRKEAFEVSNSEIEELIQQSQYLITDINKIVPTPGLYAQWCTGASIDIGYSEKALEGNDKIVNLIDEP